MFSLKHGIQKIRYFPGGPVVKVPYFHCRGYKLDPWLGGELRSHMPYYVIENKIQFKKQNNEFLKKKPLVLCKVHTPGPTAEYSMKHQVSCALNKGPGNSQAWGSWKALVPTEWQLLS